MTDLSFEALIPSAPKNRFDNITRNYTAQEVSNLKGSIEIKHSIAEHAANSLWELVNGEAHVAALGAMTGGQAVQMVRAGLKAIYLSGWQVAADANGAGQTYPDQSLYPADSGPALAKRINKALQRADQVQHMENSSGEKTNINWFAPIVADAEAGFGGPLNAFEITVGINFSGC